MQSIVSYHHQHVLSSPQNLVIGQKMSTGQKPGPSLSFPGTFSTPDRWAGRKQLWRLGVRQEEHGSFKLDLAFCAEDLNLCLTLKSLRYTDACLGFMPFYDWRVNMLKFIFKLLIALLQTHKEA